MSDELHAPVPSVAPPEAEPLTCARPDLMAIIGDEGLPMTAHDEIMSLKRRKYSDRGREIPKTAKRRYRTSIADRLIYQHLLELEHRRLGLRDDEEALAERERKARRDIEDWDEHIRRRGESDQSLRQLHLSTLREQAILEHHGMAEIGAAEIQAKYEELSPKYVSDQERMRARQIVVAVDPERPGGATQAQAQAKAGELAARARQPDVDFAELAHEHSDGLRRRTGGDLGIVLLESMDADFSAAVAKAQPGDVVTFRAKDGFHVVLVMGRWGPGALPLEALEEGIVEDLVSRNLHEARRALKDQLFSRVAILNCESERLGSDPRARAEANAKAKAGEASPNTP